MKLLISFLLGVLLVTNPAFGGTITDKNGNITFATFEGQDMQRFVSFKGENLLKQILPLGSTDKYNKVTESTDALGMSHEKFQQFYGQVPVEFGVFTLHYINGKAKSVAGEYIVVDGTCPKLPTIGANNALELAKNHVGATKYMWEDEEMEAFLKIDMNDPEATFFPEPKLVYVKDFFGGKEKARLAFKFDLYAQKPVGRSNVYVDAENGNILFENKTIYHADEIGTAETRYNGTQNITTFNNGSLFQLRETGARKCETYNMKQGINYGGAKVFTDTDNNWTTTEYNNLEKDNAALDAHYGAELSWDYWKNIHGRNSYDGIGGVIKSYVHYGQEYSNAFWDGQRVTYGDGDDEIFDALTALDVCGHEIAHGVCAKTADFFYFGEPGGLNEGFSDVWAACIEYHNGRTQDQVWLVGEDIERRPGRIALRVMSDPKLVRKPDTYYGEFWYNEVHTTSSIFNYWFYLLSMGGSGVNDYGNAYDVKGISIEKAEKIAFRAEKEYMTPGNNFAQAREIMIQCAKDLYGANAPEVKSVDDAWYAVGITAPCNIGINLENWAFKFIDVTENNATFYIENNPTIDGKIIVSFIEKDSIEQGISYQANLISGDTFKIEGLKKCTSYFLTLNIICSTGMFTEIGLNATFRSSGCICTKVEDLKVYEMKADYASFTMKNVDPSDSIEVQYKKVGSNEWKSQKDINHFGSFKEFFDFERLTPNTEYELQVRLYCNFRWEDFSESFYFKTLNAECGNVDSFGVYSIYQTSLLFFCDSKRGNAYNILKYKKVSDVNYTESIFYNQTYISLNYLIPNTEYMAFVESKCYDSIVYLSDTIYFTTIPYTCDDYNVISVVGDPKPTEATLNWFTQETATEYELQYQRIGGGNFTRKNTGLEKSYTITGLLPNKEYSAKVRPKCGGAWKRWSELTYFLTPLSTGINPSTAEIISLGIYPNPTNGNVKILSSQSLPNQLISIADIMGKTVFEKTINLEKDYPTELDLNQLSQGTYFIYTDFEGNKVANKLVIIR